MEQTRPRTRTKTVRSCCGRTRLMPRQISLRTLRSGILGGSPPAFATFRHSSRPKERRLGVVRANRSRPRRPPSRSQTWNSRFSISGACSQVGAIEYPTR
jgi:hypothetical protein